MSRILTANDRSAQGLKEIEVTRGNHGPRELVSRTIEPSFAHAIAKLAVRSEPSY